MSRSADQCPFSPSWKFHFLILIPFLLCTRPISDSWTSFPHPYASLPRPHVMFSQLPSLYHRLSRPFVFPLYSFTSLPA